MNGEQLLVQLKSAFNTHDIDAFEKCFAANYRSEQPAHPNRSFEGRGILVENWLSNFREMPDFSAEMLSTSITGNEIWAEWEWRGTRQDKSELHMKGVTIFGIAEEKIQWAKLYIEPVEKNGSTIAVAIQQVMHGKAPDETE